MESTTYILKTKAEKSPLWNCIKVTGNDCRYFADGKWLPVLDENYLDYYLKFYDPVQYEEIPTETPEETEAFNKMKPYEFDKHVSGKIAGIISNGHEPKIVSYTSDKPVFTQAMADKGGAKHDQGKPRYDLLPPIAIDEMAKVLTFGAEKYAPNSWQSVPDAINRYRAALLRHTFAIQRGELIDEESGLPHSALAMCNAAFIVELEKKC